MCLDKLIAEGLSASDAAKFLSMITRALLIANALGDTAAWVLGVDPVDWTAKVPFADVDAVVAEDGVGHGDVEIDVLDDHLQ